MVAKAPQLTLDRKPARAKAQRPIVPAKVVDRSDNLSEAGHTIQGYSASAAEWAVYTALRSLGWDDEIQFQTSVFGGRQFPGGQVLDFVIHAGPQSAVIDVRGLRWHGPQVGKSARDRWREVQLSAMPHPPRLVVVWEDVAESRERLRSLLLKELGAKR